MSLAVIRSMLPMTVEGWPNAALPGHFKCFRLVIPLTHQTPTCRFGLWRITREPSRSLRSDYLPRRAAEHTWLVFRGQRLSMPALSEIEGRHGSCRFVTLLRVATTNVYD